MSQIQVLVPPIVAMMGLAFVLSTAMRHLRATRYEQLAFGILFGCVVIISMTNPMQMGEGLIFDTRTLLTGAAVTFIGPLAGLIAMAFGIICRIYIGGTGMITGVVGLLVAFGLAYFWTCKLGCHVRNPILHDALLGAFVTLSANALFLLPAEIALAVLAKVTVPLLICNVFGMIAIGYVLRRERAYLSERHLMQTHASTDALTTLLNRRGMDSAVTKMTFNQENGHALLYFDIDNFKVINDTYGHDAGDAALAIVAARLKVIVRNEAVFARHGGDEFSIYFPNLEAGDLKNVADRLCRAISDQVFSHNGCLFSVSITIGGFWSKQDLSINDMLKRADAELLLAKRAGKNRSRVTFDKESLGSVVA